MPVEQKQMGLRVMKEFSRRAIVDASDIRILVAGGTVYLHGKIKPIRGQEGMDLKKELDIIVRNLRTVPGIREVINELDMPR